MSAELGGGKRCREYAEGRGMPTMTDQNPRSTENDALNIVRRLVVEHIENVRYNEDESDYSQGYGDALSAVETALERVTPPASSEAGEQ